MGGGEEDDDFRMESMMVSAKAGGEFAKEKLATDEKAMDAADNLDVDVDNEDEENVLDDQLTLVFEDANRALKQEMKTVTDRGNAPISQLPTGQHGRSQRDDLDRFFRKGEYW